MEGDWSLKVIKPFKSVLREFNKLGWITNLAVEDGEDIHFVLREPIIRFQKLYEKEITRVLGATINAALSENAFRFDASDLMPVEIGQGAFWSEMTELASNGPGYIDTALDNIENAWP